MGGQGDADVPSDPAEMDPEQVPVEALVYAVVTEDADGDGQLRAEDGVAVRVSSPTGGDARPVTPGDPR